MGDKKPLNAMDAMKDELLQELERTRQRTRALITSLPVAMLDVPYHPGVNPPLWEMGHSAFFYEVFVFNLLDGTASFNPAMDDLWDSFHIEHRDRWSRDLFPGHEETLAYFDTVYDRVAERILCQPLDDRTLYLNRYAIFHQNMHIESMIWCRQTVGYPAPPDATPVRPAIGEPVAGDATVPAGRWVIGMPGESAAYAMTDFAFDSEKPGFEIELDAFAISRLPVSNADFLAFVEDDGYKKPEYWSFGGRKWLQTEVDVALVHGSTEPLVRAPGHPYTGAGMKVSGRSGCSIAGSL